MNGKTIGFVAGAVALAALAVLGPQERAVDAVAKVAAPVKSEPVIPKPAPLAPVPEAKPTAVAAEKPKPLPPVFVESPKVEKTTVLPDGKVLIENKKVTLRYADGKTEERLVKITATPVQKPIQKVMREKGVKN